MGREAVIHAEQYLQPETLAQLAPFELRAKMIVEGVKSGGHRSPYRGSAVEFAEHREYVPGDELKHIDWKVYGRADKLYVKQHRLETNLDVVLLVDASASMGFGSLGVKGGWGGTRASEDGGRWTKYDHAAALAVALGYLCLHQRDRVGLVLFAERVVAALPRSSARGQWGRLVSTLANQDLGAETDCVSCVREVSREIRNRALFVMISDLLDDPAAIREALSRLQYDGHDVIVLHTVDPSELRFDVTGPGVFEGLEGEGRVRVDPRRIREEYLAALGEHVDAIRSAARGLAFEYRRVSTHESVGPALAEVLIRRSAFLRRRKLG